MHTPFAKLFNRPLYGQVLAKLDKSDSCSPELRWYVQPDGFGACSFAIVFKDSDAGFNSAQAALDRADDAAADAAAKTLFNAIESV